MVSGFEIAFEKRHLSKIMGTAENRQSDKCREMSLALRQDEEHVFSFQF